jgi:hypothetical protein
MSLRVSEHGKAMTSITIAKVFELVEYIQIEMEQEGFEVRDKTRKLDIT